MKKEKKKKTLNPMNTISKNEERSSMTIEKHTLFGIVGEKKEYMGI
jgi:hypothetical protein